MTPESVQRDENPRTSATTSDTWLSHVGDWAIMTPNTLMSFDGLNLWSEEGRRVIPYGLKCALEPYMEWGIRGAPVSLWVTGGNG